MKSIKEVEEELQKLLKETEANSGNAEIFNEIGVGYMIIGEHEKAISYLKQAYRLKKKSKYLYNLAIAHSENDEPHLSVDLYLRVLENQPDHIPSLNNLADCYEQTGDVAKAAELFSYLTKINDEDPLSHFNYGNFLLRQNRHIEAVKKYEDALERDELYTEAYYNISWVLMKAGAEKKALEYAEKGLASSPEHEELSALKSQLISKISAD